jgi:ketosteroid isomerase-like protein
MPHGFLRHWKFDKRGILMGISADTVREIFSHLEAGAGDRFFEHVSENVDWTVQGTHPLAGRYTSKRDFRIHTFDRLIKILPGGAQLRVQQILIDGDWAAVELRSHATAITGMRFDNRYCWVIRFDENLIVEVRAYLDSALVQKLIDETGG